MSGRIIACLGLSLAFTVLSGQADTLKFVSGEYLVGEIEVMERGVLTIETDFSDSDFKIEWNKVTGIISETSFMVTLSSGRKYFGTLRSLTDSTVQILSGDTAKVCLKNEIVNLNPYDEKFFDRISASISLGLDMSKSRKLRSFASRSSLGYKAERWSSRLTFNMLRSDQEGAEDIENREADLNFRYEFLRKWYCTGAVSALSNTEQKLDLRLNSQLGLGNYLVRTNSIYWGLKLGGNRNVERYSNETEDRNSWEVYLGTELNLFDTGDLSFQLVSMFYPSLTENERWRNDTKLDFKYDLPYDFYINLGVTFTYDNQPAEGAEPVDYILQTGVGWEWE